MGVLILVVLCCLFYYGASAKHYDDLEQAEKRCIAKSFLSNATSYRYQCRLKSDTRTPRFHFVHFDTARAHCIKQAKNKLGFVCCAIRPIGVEPLIRDLSDLDLDLNLE